MGDAAHAALPTSGQGACQAIEDAWHLRQCLTAGDGNLATTLATFAHRRAGKTVQIAMSGRQLARSLFSTDAAACEARDRASAATDYAKAAVGMGTFWADGLHALATQGRT